jgi:hypothetical protein
VSFELVAVDVEHSATRSALFGFSALPVAALTVDIATGFLPLSTSPISILTQQPNPCYTVAAAVFGILHPNAQQTPLALTSSSAFSLNQQSPRLPRPPPILSAARTRALWRRQAIEPRKQETARADRHLAGDSQTAGRWSESNLSRRSNLHDDEDDDNWMRLQRRRGAHVAGRTYRRRLATRAQSSIASIARNIATLTGVSS